MWEHGTLRSGIRNSLLSGTQYTTRATSSWTAISWSRWTGCSRSALSLGSCLLCCCIIYLGCRKIDWHLELIQLYRLIWYYINLNVLPVRCATTAACFAAAACWDDPFDEYSFAAIVVTAEEVPVEEGIVDGGGAEGTFVDFIIPPPPPALVPSSWYMPPDIAVHVKGRISTGTHIDAEE